MAHAAAATLADRFATEAERGLRQFCIDVAWSLEASVDAVATEVSGLFAAVDAGQAKPLDFSDATRR